MRKLSDLLRMTSELEIALASPSCWASSTLQCSPNVGVHSEGSQLVLVDECLGIAALRSEIFKCFYKTQGLVHQTMGQLQKKVKNKHGRGVWRPGYFPGFLRFSEPFSAFMAKFCNIVQDLCAFIMQFLSLEHISLTHNRFFTCL